MASVTEDIKARIDIVNYISQYVPLKKAGRYYKACCPFHAEKTPSFVVNADTQSWRCFGACAEGGDLFNFAMKQNGWSFPEALEELGKQAGVEVRKQSPQDKQRAEHQDKLRGLLQTAAEMYHTKLIQDPESVPVLDYARQQRGFTDQTIQDYMIGYAPPGWQNMLNALTNLGYEEDLIIEAGVAVKNDSGRVYDRFRNRLMIPIRDDRGRTIGFGARVLDPEDNPKYLNSPQTPVFDKSKVLFGLDVAKQVIRETETAVIVEGYMDVIQAHQAGFMNVVAQMGTAMTETQIARIAPRYAKKIVLALDSDAAGQNATRRSLETARQTLAADFAGRLSVDMRVLQIPDAKDPDDLIRETPDQWAQLVDNAMAVADFVIEMEAQHLTPDSSIQEREAVAKRLLPILVASESDFYKQENLQKLAMRLRIGERDLLVWSEAQKRKESPPQASVREDEPPPLDYDSLEPPPEDDEDDAIQIIPDAVIPDSKVDARCLRILFENPDLYYQVNRRFRELANGNEALHQGPLDAVGEADFSRVEDQQLMQMFQVAVQQHEMEVVDYLREHIDFSLQQRLGQILVTDGEQIRHNLKNRFGAELQHIIKQVERQSEAKPAVEIIEKAVILRKQRLEQEMNEIRFMQMQEDDPDLSLHLSMQVALRKQAKQLLDQELQEQQFQFT